MENQLTTIDQPAQAGALVAIEQSRAVQEVQASLVIAKKFPRDLTKAFNSIIEACKRPSFAKIALYSYKRGGQTISDGSIRLAELMAQNFGNLDFGVRELEQEDGVSVCESFCFDKETNTRQTKTFHVQHKFKANGAMKELTDNRDIYEYVANQGARRLRACIFGVIPFDFKEAAILQIRKTLANETASMPLVDKIREIVGIFKSHFQVTPEMLADYLGHKVEDCNVDEVVDLQGILNSLKDKATKREDWFNVGVTREQSPATNLSDKLRAQQQTPEAAPVEQQKTAPNILQIKAGELLCTAWPEYRELKIKDVPENELLAKLSQIETQSHQGPLSEDTINFYGASCTYLNRKRNLKG